MNHSLLLALAMAGTVAIAHAMAKRRASPPESSRARRPEKAEAPNAARACSALRSASSRGTPR